MCEDGWPAIYPDGSLRIIHMILTILEQAPPIDKLFTGKIGHQFRCTIP